MGKSSNSDLLNKSESVISDVVSSDKGFENFTSAVNAVNNKAKKKNKSKPIVVKKNPDLTPIPEKKESDRHLISRQNRCKSITIHDVDAIQEAEKNPEDLIQ